MAQLKGRQKTALTSLLQGATVPQAATAAGVDRVTVWRWLQSPDFAAEYARSSDLVLTTAARRLSSVSDLAVSVLVDVATDAGMPPGVRLRAADLLLSHGARLAEIAVIMQRLEALEARYE